MLFFSFLLRFTLSALTSLLAGRAPGVATWLRRVTAPLKSGTSGTKGANLLVNVIRVFWAQTAQNTKHRWHQQRVTQTGSPSRQRRASPSLSNELSLEAYQTENFDRPIEETLFCLQIARFARNFLKKIPMLSNLTILLWNGDGLWVDQEEESVSKTDQYRAYMQSSSQQFLTSSVVHFNFSGKKKVLWNVESLCLKLFLSLFIQLLVQGLTKGQVRWQPLQGSSPKVCQKGRIIYASSVKIFPG